MSQDLPCISYMALYIVSMHVITSNSKTSTYWKLNSDLGKVQSASAAEESSIDNDPLMSILTSKVTTKDGQWTLIGHAETEHNLHEENIYFEKSQGNFKSGPGLERKSQVSEPTKTKTGKNGEDKKLKNEKNYSKKPVSKSVLDCGEVINNTEWDHLPGVVNRNIPHHIPEPEVAMTFKKKNSKSEKVDMNELERKLRKAKKEKPNSYEVYNQIGNFWRIQGNTQLSIRCFRKALSISPQNSDVLINLARVLFNLGYLEDAYQLSQSSLSFRRNNQSPWLQYYTLGEVLKQWGHYKEALNQFRKALQENPNFQQAEAYVRELEMVPDTTMVTYYTLFIIVFLVLGVMCGILTSMDGMFEDISETSKTQRHFNRAMAMRSIKLGIKPNLIRMRKQMSQ